MRSFLEISWMQLKGVTLKKNKYTAASILAYAYVLIKKKKLNPFHAQGIVGN